MKILLKTLYITSPETMTLNGDNLVVTRQDGESEETKIVPLRGLEAVCYCGHKAVSPALMDACAKHNIRLTVFHTDGRFISNITGNNYDGFLLRRKQYAAAGNPDIRLEIARNIIAAKAFNSRWLIGRMYREYEGLIDVNFTKNRQEILKKLLSGALAARDIESLRETKKNTARELYSSIGRIIVRQKQTFNFKGRRAKAPADPVNALLSFSYGLLEEICTSAILSAGLDPYVGFFHKEKPGRAPLVSDLMEEFKACIADRFVIMMINGQKIGPGGFEEAAEGDFILSESGTSALLEYWQEFTGHKIIHPYIEEKIEWGMLPYASAGLLSRFLSGRIEKYPPFFRQDP